LQQPYVPDRTPQTNALAENSFVDPAILAFDLKRMEDQRNTGWSAPSIPSSSPSNPYRPFPLQSQTLQPQLQPQSMQNQTHQTLHYAPPMPNPPYSKAPPGFAPMNPPPGFESLPYRVYKIPNF